jgi:hypothetical protein
MDPIPADNKDPIADEEEKLDLQEEQEEEQLSDYLDIDELMDSELSKGKPSNPEKIDKAVSLGFEVPDNNQVPQQRSI